MKKKRKRSERTTNGAKRKRKCNQRKAKTYKEVPAVGRHRETSVPSRTEKKMKGRGNKKKKEKKMTERRQPRTNTAARPTKEENERKKNKTKEKNGRETPRTAQSMRIRG